MTLDPKTGLADASLNGLAKELKLGRARATAREAGYQDQELDTPWRRLGVMELTVALMRAALNEPAGTREAGFAQAMSQLEIEVGGHTEQLIVDLENAVQQGLMLLRRSLQSADPGMGPHPAETVMRNALSDARAHLGLPDTTPRPPRPPAVMTMPARRIEGEQTIDRVRIELVRELGAAAGNAYELTADVNGDGMVTLNVRPPQGGEVRSFTLESGDVSRSLIEPLVEMWNGGHDVVEEQLSTAFHAVEEAPSVAVPPSGSVPPSPAGPGTARVPPEETPEETQAARDEMLYLRAVGAQLIGLNHASVNRVVPLGAGILAEVTDGGGGWTLQMPVTVWLAEQPRRYQLVHTLVSDDELANESGEKIAETIRDAAIKATEQQLLGVARGETKVPVMEISPTTPV